MNTKLLRKIQNHILAEPKRLDMGIFIVRKENHRKLEVQLLHDYPKCGTVGCIAGWAVTLSTKEKVPYGKIQARAAALLDITEPQAERLFYETFWPAKFQEQLENSDEQTRAHARATSARIDHFIKTKGVE